MTYSIPQTPISQAQKRAFSIESSTSMNWLKSIRGFGRLSYDLGIDLGTANTVIHIPEQGIVVQEPSVLVLNARTQIPIAFGTEAQQMLGRNTSDVTVIRPMRNGVVADFERTKLMLQHFIQQAYGSSVFRPRIVIGVSSGATQVERWALVDLALQAGARKAYLINEPIAAALGTNLPIDGFFGNLIVDIGGGTTEVAVISQLQTVVSESISVAGDAFNQSIGHYLRHSYALRVGELTAERLKIRHGSASPNPQRDNGTFEVVGLRLDTGLTGHVVIQCGELREALAQPLAQIVSTVKAVMGKMSPELVSDICDRGIMLTGGGALLPGLDTLLSQETGLIVHTASDPLISVALGAGAALKNRQYESVLNLAT